MPLKKISVFKDESILEARKVMMQEKIDVMPVVEREDPAKVTCVLTTEGVAAAYETAKNLR